MRRETAYKLAGRKHDHASHHAGSGIAKTREIRFKDFPPGQAAQAWRSLAALRGVQVEAGRDELTLVVHYNVLDFTLQLLDEALVLEGVELARCERLGSDGHYASPSSRLIIRALSGSLWIARRSASRAASMMR